MHSKTIMLVTLSVSHAREAEFNRFYQHDFLPATLKHVTEFTSVRRYSAVSSADNVIGKKRTLTWYEIESQDKAEAAFTGFARPQLAEHVAQFGQWKEDDFGEFTRVLYQLVYQHPRGANETSPSNRAMILMSHEIKPELLAGFQEWLQEKHLPRLMADVPALANCAQYISIGATPARHLTVLECHSEAALPSVLADIAASHRADENEAFAKWENVGADFSERTAYRQIFRWPD